MRRDGPNPAEPPRYTAFPGDEDPWFLTRGFLASVLGPMRTGVGQTAKVEGNINTPARLAAAEGKRVFFVQVITIPAQNVIFGTSEGLANNNNPSAPTGAFSQVLFPGDALWAQCVLPATFIVTQVRF